MPRRRLGTDGRKSWHQLCIGCIVACWPRASCSGLSLGRRAIVGTECCRLWRVLVEMDRHSGSNSSGPTGTFSSAPGWWQGNDYDHREANAKGKPNIADTDAPNKLEPRIDSGTCRPAPGIARTACPLSTSFGIISKFQHASANVGAWVSKARRNAREV